MGFTPADVLMMQQRLARGPEATQGVDAGEEIEKLHRPALKWLRENGHSFIYNRPDRASTGTPGAPDLVVAAGGGRILFIEFKTKSGKLSREQVTWHHLAATAGHTVHVVRSIEAFMELMK